MGAPRPSLLPLLAKVNSSVIAAWKTSAVIVSVVNDWGGATGQLVVAPRVVLVLIGQLVVVVGGDDGAPWGSRPCGGGHAGATGKLVVMS